MSDKLPDVILIDELATLLRCSRRTIDRRLAAKDNLPPRLPSIDNRHRWSRAAVEAWLQNPGKLWKSGLRRAS